METPQTKNPTLREEDGVKTPQADVPPQVFIESKKSWFDLV